MSRGGSGTPALRPGDGLADRRSDRGLPGTRGDRHDATRHRTDDAGPASRTGAGRRDVLADPGPSRRPSRAAAAGSGARRRRPESAAGGAHPGRAGPASEARSGRGGGSAAESDAPAGRSWSWRRWPARSPWAGRPAAADPPRLAVLRRRGRPRRRPGPRFVRERRAASADAPRRIAPMPMPSRSGPPLGAPVADAEVPVVFPGYVLPDDSREEPAHEGS